MKLSQPSGQQQQKDQSKAAPTTTLLKVLFPLRAEGHLTLPCKMVQSGKAPGEVRDLLLGPPSGISAHTSNTWESPTTAPSLTAGLLRRRMCILAVMCLFVTTAARMTHYRLKTP